MKITLRLIMLSILLTACGSLSSDETIRRKAVGTWAPISHPSRVIQNKPDGSFVCQDAKSPANVLTVAGRWQVTDGFMVMRGTNASLPGAEPLVERYQVVRIDDREMVLRRDGQTNLITVHKR